MVVLSKLKLKGIRSYSTDESSVIHFDSSLTMILGPNGTGKTTIIEALKYATTGELPINTRGGAFINDPKIQNKYINTGEVSLEFVNCNNVEIKVKRKLQATVRNNSITQKTVENTLLSLNNDKWDVLTSKSADIDRELSFHLGVSQSLLQNVVFCHQEEANWILSEPINVKKKLDEIFATTKYSKALDTLKKIRKDAVQTLKMKNVELTGLTDKKMKKERMVSDIEDTKTNIRNINAKLTSSSEHEIDLEIKELLLKISSEKEKEKECIFIRCEIEALKIKLEGMHCNFPFEKIRESLFCIDDYIYETENFKNSKENLSFLNHDKSSLKRNIYNTFSDIYEHIENIDFTCIVNNLNNDIFAINNLNKNICVNLKEFTDVSLQIPHLYSHLSSCMKEIKLLEEESSKIEKSLEEDAGLNGNNYSKLLNDLQNTSECHELNAEIKCAEKDFKVLEEEEFENKLRLNQLKMEITSKDSKIELLGSDNEKINEDLQEICNFDNSGLELNNEETLIADKTKYLKDLKLLEYELQEYANHNQKVIINKQKIEIRTQYEIELKNKFNEFMSFNREIQLIYEKEGLEMCKSEIYCIDNYDKFLNISEKDFESIKTKIQEIIIHKRSLNKAFDDLKEQISKLRSIKTTVFVSDLFLHRNENNPNILKIKIDENANLLNLTESAKILFSNFEKKGSKRSVCYLCERKLDQNELIKYQNHICLTINELDEKIKVLNIEKDDIKNRYVAENENMAIKTKIRDLTENIRNSLFKIITKISKTEQLKRLVSILTLTNWENELEDYDLDKLLHEIEVKIMIKDLEQFKEKINSMFYLMKIKDEIKHKFNSICIENNSIFIKDIRSIEESINKLKINIENCDHEIIRIQKNRHLYEKSKTRKTLEIKLKNNQLDLADLFQMISEDKKQEEIYKQKGSKLVIKKHSLYERIESLKIKQIEVNERYKNKYLKVSFYIKILEEKKKVIINKKEEFKESFKNYLETASVCITDQNFNKYVDSEESKFMEIFLNQKHEKIMNDCFSQISKFNYEKERLDKEIEAKDFLKTKIDILQTLHKNKTEKERLQILESKIKEINHANIECLEIKLETIKKQKEEIMKERHLMEGELKQLNNNLKNYNYVYETDFKNIDILHNNLYVEIKTTDLIISDLEKSIKALDSSITEYYKSKIEEINTILKDLWINTYKGNDIDYIELKNEFSDNKTYNYKLVMYKNGVELDMRGRCSAGQKVMAGILTRLALCDAFCASCFVIGLDEPTTNLDKENIESLAHTIKTVVEERNRSGSFQLLVITHDEIFAETISQNGCDTFYRISKDFYGNSQVSLCTKNDFK